MKTSLATSLSIIGVLATGGVALAANPTVLGPPSSSAQGLAPALAVSADSTVPISATAQAMVQSAYNVQGVGIITLGQNATALSVVAVEPITGWTYTAANEHSTRVEITFSAGTQIVKFNANLIDGRLVTAVQASDTAATPAGKDDGEVDDQSDDKNGDEVDDQSDDQGDDEGDDQSDDQSDDQGDDGDQDFDAVGNS